MSNQEWKWSITEAKLKGKNDVVQIRSKTLKVKRCKNQHEPLEAYKMLTIIREIANQMQPSVKKRAANYIRASNDVIRAKWLAMSLIQLRVSASLQGKRTNS